MSAKEPRAHQPHAALRSPSPFNGSTGANNSQVLDTPILGNNHYPPLPAPHRPISPPPSLPATAPRDVSSPGQGVNPASRAKAAKPKAGTASNSSQYRLKRTAKKYRKKKSTASRSSLQYGEPGTNDTNMSHRAPKARLHHSSENTLVELDKHRDESYGRSRLARGRAGLSHVHVPVSQATTSKGVSLEGRQPQPTANALKWKYYEPPPAEGEAEPPSYSPSTTSTASEGSGWTSLPASPDLPSSSSAIRAPSAASASSTSSSSSSSPNKSQKRKREGDEPSASSSRPAKKSKPTGQGTMCMQVPLKLRHVVVDPSLPRPEGNWRPSTGKGRIQVWLEQDEVEVEVEVEGDGMEVEDEVEI